MENNKSITVSSKNSNNLKKKFVWKHLIKAYMLENVPVETLMYKVLEIRIKHTMIQTKNNIIPLN